MVPGPALHSKHSTNKKRMIFYNSQSIIIVILKIKETNLMNIKIAMISSISFYAYLQEKIWANIL